MTMEIRGGESTYRFDMSAGSGAKEPTVVYVEPYADLSDSITINYLAVGRTAWLQWRKLGDENWQRTAVSRTEFPRRREMIHRVSLTGLDSATTYEFRPEGTDAVSKFKTLAASPTSVTVCAISDLHSTSMVGSPTSQANALNDLIAAQVPDFVFLVGDFLDDEGRTTDSFRADKWYQLLKDMSTRWVRSDGTLIPMGPVLGNHDGRLTTTGFTGVLFDWPHHARENVGGVGYGTVAFGDRLLLIGLKVGPIDSTPPYIPDFDAQKEWLSNLLETEAGNYEHILVGAHIGPYPSVLLYDNYYDTLWRVRTRREIVPMLQQYPNCRFFVNGHDHNPICTHPIVQEPGEENFTRVEGLAWNEYGYGMPGGEYPDGPNGMARRWRRDDDNGLVFIGSGTWGSGAFYGQGYQLISTIDGSSYVDALITAEPGGGASVVRTVGDIAPISSNPTSAAKNFWRLDFSSGSARARCINLEGGVYIDRARSIPE